jgi:hypothetical protein
MQIALMVKHGRDSLPENAHRIETDWRNPAPETPAGTTDAIAKQVAAGIIPPRSDVTLKRLSYSPVERARLTDDWTDEQGRTALQDIHDMLKQRAQGGAPAEPAQPAGPSPADMPKKVPVRGDGEPR